MYSQFDEERYILENTPSIGKFLDIGAYHPTHLSNTRALYERGWSGVMVEPSPVPFNSLLKEYGNDNRITLILAAVGCTKGGLHKFHVTETPFSTSEDWWFEESKIHAGFYGTMYVPAITLSDIGDCFDFISVDTEGTSYAVALLCSDQIRPQCMCVEAHEDIVGYSRVYESESNTVYVRL